MSRLRPVFLFLMIVLLILGLNQTRAEEQNQPRGQPGAFDYYLLSLSWSPEYCAGPTGENDQRQCGEGRRYGFVVHGLWPEYEKGYPQFCEPDSRVSTPLVHTMLPIMPSEELIRHEWQKHGTCSGLAAEQYFDKTQQAFARIIIPARYKTLTSAMTIKSRRLKQDLASVNPRFTEESFAVLCRDRFFSEVRICLDKNLEPRACSAEVKDACPSEKIILRPVR
ncbi:MAG: ribonuclease T2 [Deltaproteobacteria bacterium]|nr:ribonuclease T2 [Deltaproteobacteria bacterium]